MTRRTRLVLLVPICVALGAFLLWALTGLPSFGDFHGPYGQLLTRVGVAQRHASNVVATVVFDYRGLDTLGEEFILFASAAGVAFLLRASRELKEQQPRDEVANDALRVAGLAMVPVTALIGLWLVAYGYVTPGGGFQGGVVIAAAVALLWVAGSYPDFTRLAPERALDGFGSVGAGGFVVIGLIGLGASGAFLANFLDLGTPGSLTSGGSIGLLNAATALEVAAANVLIVREFLIEYVQVLPGVREE